MREHIRTRAACVKRGEGFGVYTAVLFEILDRIDATVGDGERIGSVNNGRVLALALKSRRNLT